MVQRFGRDRLRLLLDHFARVGDPREACKVRYPLGEVLFPVTCATIAGCDDSDEIAGWGVGHLDFLRGYGEFFFGTPKEDWLGVVLDRIDPDDWLHLILAALYHDIGYARGVCAGDRANAFHRETGTEAGLMRAVDPIGQLGDPLYPRKLNALFHEFADVGFDRQLGYAGPADLAERYPAFFWGKLEPVTGDAVRFLDLTVEGRSWVANLYSHVFAIEHDRRRIGPHAG